MKKLSVGFLTVVIIFSCTFNTKKNNYQTPVSVEAREPISVNDTIVSVKDTIDSKKVDPPVIIEGQPDKTIKNKADQKVVRSPSLDTIAVH